MQIHRFDLEPHSLIEAKGPLRPKASHEIGSSSGSESRADASKGMMEKSASPWAQLVERFKSVPEIRSDAVEAAREKVARGLYSTREAAEQLAGTNLRQEYFLNRP